MTCINFWKFHDDLKACLEVIRLPSWLENVKFSVNMQFFVFDPLKDPFFSSWQIWNLVFLKVDLEVFTFPQNQYIYLNVWAFKGTLKMLQITFCLQIQKKNPWIGDKIWTTWVMQLEFLEFSILNETIKWWIFQRFYEFD